MTGLEALAPILVAVIVAATPILLAAAGELVVEKAGVLNLGIEGMMLVGAVTGFVVAASTGSGALGVLAAAAAALLLAALFGLLTLVLMTNQVATGLALTLFGVGLSALVGKGFVGMPIAGLPKLDIPALSDLPLLGPVLFGHDALVYLSVALVVAIHLFLTRTRAGLVVRAIGESPEAAHEHGYPVIRIRFLAVLFGGAMSGVAGGYLSLAYTPMWAENMTAGRGWIALALIVFATWRPFRLLFGAYLFGLVSIGQLHAQSFGVPVPAEFLSMLPYLATIAVLAVISRNRTWVRLNAPASIGRPFHPGT